MKITRRQLIKLIREFRDLGDDFSDLDLTSGPPSLPPIDDDDEGGPPKDWPLEVITRLKKIGYKVFVRGDGIIPFKRQVYKNMPAPNVNITIDALDDGVTIAIGFARNQHVTNAFAANMFVRCYDAMETNNAMRLITTVAKTLENKNSLDIHEDLRQLESKGASDPEPTSMEDFLNSNAFLIKYYSQHKRK